MREGSVDMDEEIGLWNVSELGSCLGDDLLVKHAGYEVSLVGGSSVTYQRYPSGHDVLWCHIIRRS